MKRFHSLRHSGATWLVQAGVSIYTVSKILGHASVSTTQIYAHYEPDQYHNAVNSVQLL
jgi:site-specific recombinase XerD